MNAQNNAEEFVKIKKSRSLTPWLALVAFALTAASVYCLLVPLVFYRMDKLPYYVFISAGAVGTLYFLGFFIYEIVQLFSPKNALIVSAQGFLDLLNGSSGAGFIGWGNVTKVEIEGDEKPYIAIGLLDISSVPNIKDKKLKKQLESKDDMPELYIKPYEIGMTLDEAFSVLRTAREAYYRECLPSGNTEILSDTNMHTIRASVSDTKNSSGAEDERSIDELLKELSGEIEKRRRKLSGDTKKSSEELEDIIRYVKGKQ